MRNNIKRKKSSAEETKYYWDKFEAPYSSYYTWNKYNINATNTYKWGKYNTESDVVTSYKWDVYNAGAGYIPVYAKYTGENTTASITHKWNKYNTVGVTNTTYTWDKSQPRYVWNKYTKVTPGGGGGPNYYLDTVKTAYSPVGLGLMLSEDGFAKAFRLNETTYRAYQYITGSVSAEEDNYFTYITSSNIQGNQAAQNYELHIKYYDSITINPDTGAKIYGSCYKKPGTQQDFELVVGLPRFSYSQANDTFTDRWISGDPTSGNNKSHFGSFNLSVGNNMAYYVAGDNANLQTYEEAMANNLDIINESYPYMEVTVSIVSGASSTPIYTNCILKTLKNPTMLLYYQTYNGGTGSQYSASGYYISAKEIEDSETGFKNIQWRLTNVEVQYILSSAGSGGGGEVTPGSFIEIVTSTSPNAYPLDGYDNDYYYIYQDLEAGDFVETVSSTNSNAYPDNGLYNGYYYSNKGEVPPGELMKGSYIGEVTSANENAYPTNGIDGSYWYTYTGYSVANNYRRFVDYCPAFNTWAEATSITDTSRYFELFAGTTLYFSASSQPVITDAGMYEFTDTSQVTSVTLTTANIPGLANIISQNGFKYFIPSGTSGRNYYDVYTGNQTPNTIVKLINGHYILANISRYSVYLYSGTYKEARTYVGLTSDNSDTDYVYASAYNEVTYSAQGTVYYGEVTSTSSSTYPHDGAEGDYYYIYKGSSTDTGYVRTTFIEQVTSTSQNAYPIDGKQGNYWYSYRGYTTNTAQGTLVGQVTSTHDSAYPNNDAYNGYYYVKQGSASLGYYKGKYIETISSTNSSQYPVNNYQTSGSDTFWYVRWPDDGYYPSWNDYNIIGGVKYQQNVNPDKDYIIGAVATASLEFLTTTNEFSNYSKFKYLSNMSGNDEKLIGEFNIDTCEVTTDGGYKVVMYDNISFFNEFVDDWIAAQTYPTTLATFYHNLCDHFSVAYSTKTLQNSNFVINDNFEGINITGVQLLGYIAEAAGGYACANATGEIEIRYFTDNGITVDNSMYSKFFHADYTTPRINKLIIQMTADDVGTIATTALGSQQYNIVNNPLFYNDTTADNQGAADVILSVMNQVTYTPAEVTMLEDYNINCGDIITVDDVTFYVMDKRMTDSGVKLTCYGNKERLNSGSSLNTEIIALRGKSNELTRTIEETQSILTDTAAGLRSQITQTANNINLQISKQNQTISQIRAGLDGIQLTYNSANGTASIRIGDVTVTNLVDGKYVQAAVAGISMTGYVTFNALKASGQTVINGDNITTGTIDAARLNLTGAITWGDFSPSTQNTIASLGASGGVPDYIKSTYIDSVSIYSPRIYGATITAGTSAKGWISLTSTGMNFCNSSGPLIGMGYYAGNYNYPYIIFGQGVDEYGTDRGMVKKYSNGMWIGDSDGVTSTTVGYGTGIFIDFNTGTFYKYVNGVATAF